MATAHLTESKVCLSKVLVMPAIQPLEFTNALLYFAHAQEKESEFIKARIGANELRY